LISATVIGVLAQRARAHAVCACKQLDADTRDMLVEVAKPWRLSGDVRMYKPVGCLRADIRAIAAASPVRADAAHAGGTRTRAPHLRQSLALRHLRLRDGMRRSAGSAR